MLNRIKTNQYKIRGFTLVEVIVVVFVITIGLLAVFNIIQNITIFSRLAASRLTAVYLAQEGIELVRNQRDTNWLEGVDWDNGLTGCELFPFCQFGVINIDGFTRNISIVPDGSNKMDVSVDVTWQERGREYSVTNATELHNWLMAP